MLSEKSKDILKKQHYSLAGNHSAVKVCEWTKKSLTDSGECYKEQFYGIKSHLCCQMTPWLGCPNQCLHCWRAFEVTLGDKFNKIDNSKEIIKKSIESQRKLLSGFKGYEKTNLKKFKQSQNPEHFAISLSGEPTLYPKLGELVKELRKQGKTSFIVTNGLQPEVLRKLEKENCLPTQLYVSLNYPNEKLFRKITQNKNKDAWKDFNKTLGILANLKTRTVIRMTLVRDLNMEDNMLENYAKLIKKANPLFLEIKGFMSVGFARERLGYERMPRHKEIRNFSEKLTKLTNLQFLDEKIESRVVLLGKSREEMKIKKI